MRLFLYEMRKLWQPRVLLVLVGISFLFFELFLGFYFREFPNGRPAGDHITVSKEMVATYGKEMDKEEFMDFKDTYVEEKEQASAYIRSTPEGQKVGLKSYEQYNKWFSPTKEKMEQEGITEEEAKLVEELHSKIMFEDGVDRFWELQARESLIDNYEDIVLNGKAGRTYTNQVAQQERIDQHYSKNGFQSMFPSIVLENFNTLMMNTGLLIVVAVMVVVGRLFIVDQQNEMVLLQYSSRKGRKLFHSKFWAGQATAFFIASLYLMGFFLLYNGQDVGMFLNVSLHSFDSYPYFWFDFTFLGYIITTIVIVYVFAFLAAAVSAVLSRLASNYFMLIGTQIPVSIILILLLLQFSLNYVFSLRYPFWLHVSLLIGYVGIGVGVYVMRKQRERNVDIL